MLLLVVPKIYRTQVTIKIKTEKDLPYAKQTQ